MFCNQCGKQLENTGMRFCPACGSPLPVPAQAQPVPSAPARPSFDYAYYVLLVKGGDSQAFQTLYEATYKDMYYLSLKLMKSEAEAEDVLQDAYIRAWNNIGSLTDPNAFRGWLSRIVTNTAKNALAKNSPVLFSQMANEDDDGEEYTFDIVDEASASQPELNYTEKETQDLVREMIDSLSDEQRFCILMFHLENQSIRDIAETLGVSENTVKSRLNYGRKNLAKKAEELQKKGYTLFTITPLPLLLYLLRCEQGSASAANAAGIAMQHSRGIVFSNIYAAPQVPTNAYYDTGYDPNYNSGYNYNNIPSHRTAAESVARPAQSAFRTASPIRADYAASAVSGTAKTAAKVSFFSTAGGKIAAAAAAVVVAGGVFAGGTVYAIQHGSSASAPSTLEAQPTITAEISTPAPTAAAPSEGPTPTPSPSVTPTPSESAAPAGIGESGGIAPVEKLPSTETTAPAESETPTVSETPAESEAPTVSEVPAETEAPAVSEEPVDTSDARTALEAFRQDSSNYTGDSYAGYTVTGYAYVTLEDYTSKPGLRLIIAYDVPPSYAMTSDTKTYRVFYYNADVGAVWEDYVEGYTNTFGNSSDILFDSATNSLITINVGNASGSMVYYNFYDANISSETGCVSYLVEDKMSGTYSRWTRGSSGTVEITKDQFNSYLSSANSITFTSF